MDKVASPNPMVGAVVVPAGEIAGRGFHPRAGEPRAEIFALREARDRAGGSTLYVTLEPCTAGACFNYDRRRFGRTSGKLEGNPA